MITGETVSLKPLERRHLDATRAWANDPELARVLDRASPVSEAEHERWFATLHERSGCVYFAIERNEDGAHIGNVWLWDIDGRHRKAEIRIVVGAPEGQNRGMGTEALELLSTYAFERLHLHKVYAYVLAINPRALRAFEKAGFSVEGILKADRWAGSGYTDVYLLGKLADA
jgi:diamine N-acetyltransferase